MSANHLILLAVRSKSCCLSGGSSSKAFLSSTRCNTYLTARHDRQRFKHYMLFMRQWLHLRLAPLEIFKVVRILEQLAFPVLSVRVTGEALADHQ